MVGSNNRCSAKDLKNYSTNRSNSNILINHFTTFTNNVENEIKYKSYFKKKYLYNKYLKLAILVIAAISSILGLIINTSSYINIFNYYLAIIFLSILYFIIISLDKGRTKLEMQNTTLKSTHHLVLIIVILLVVMDLVVVHLQVALVEAEADGVVSRI